MRTFNGALKRDDRNGLGMFFFRHKLHPGVYVFILLNCRTLASVYFLIYDTAYTPEKFCNESDREIPNANTEIQRSERNVT